MNMQDVNISRPLSIGRVVDCIRVIVVNSHRNTVDAVWLLYPVFFVLRVCSYMCVCFQLKMVLIKCCDISNEVRPTEVAEPWVDCLLEEYFMQVTSAKAIFESHCLFPSR